MTHQLSRPTSRRDAEVIVVGGGPAGAAVATQLARAGHDVLLLEGRNLAQERPAELRSGEVFSPGAQHELRRLHPSASSNHWRFESFRLLRNVWPGGHCTDDTLPPGLEYWQIHRARFDRALLALAQEAGVRCHDRQRVRDLLRDDAGRVTGVVTRDGALPGREWRAPLVVDASGRYSAILAQLRLKQPDPEFRRAALVTFYQSFPDARPGLWEQHFLRRSGAAIKGARMADSLYRFSLELDLTARDAYAARHSAHTPHALTLAILRDLAPDLYERFRASTPLEHSTAYRQLAFRVPRLTSDGLLLIGDAAGYLDPGTGQGIEFALRTARVAATVIDRALQAGDCRAARFADYVTLRQREIARAMRWLRLYLRLSHQPAALALCGHLAPVRRMLIGKMVPVPRDDG